MILWSLLMLGQIPALPSVSRELISRTTEDQFVSSLLDEGQYIRFGTKEAGPVHVWIPPNYRAETASLVVYVHGFFSNADDAIAQHQLTRQFRASGKNAMLVVCEARAARGEPVLWGDLNELVSLVKLKTNMPMPKSLWVALGHSAAYRTIGAWFANENLKKIILIDGLYGDDLLFEKWLKEPGHQLVLVGFDTAKIQETLADRTKAMAFDSLPFQNDVMPLSVRKAPLVTFFSDRTAHMELVTEAQLIPWLLKNFL
jgi:hypothetical protein